MLLISLFLLICIRLFSLTDYSLSPAPYTCSLILTIHCQPFPLLSPLPFHYTCHSLSTNFPYSCHLLSTCFLILAFPYLTLFLTFVIPCQLFLILAIPFWSFSLAFASSCQFTPLILAISCYSSSTFISLIFGILCQVFSFYLSLLGIPCQRSLLCTLSSVESLHYPCHPLITKSLSFDVSWFFVKYSPLYLSSLVKDLSLP